MPLQDAPPSTSWKGRPRNGSGPAGIRAIASSAPLTPVVSSTRDPHGYILLLLTPTGWSAPIRHRETSMTRQLVRATLAVFVAAMLAGCAGSRAEPAPTPQARTQGEGQARGGRDSVKSEIKPYREVITEKAVSIEKLGEDQADGRDETTATRYAPSARRLVTSRLSSGRGTR